MTTELKEALAAGVEAVTDLELTLQMLHNVELASSFRDDLARFPELRAAYSNARQYVSGDKEMDALLKQFDDVVERPLDQISVNHSLGNTGYTPYSMKPATSSMFLRNLMTQTKDCKVLVDGASHVVDGRKTKSKGAKHKQQTEQFKKLIAAKKREQANTEKEVAGQKPAKKPKVAAKSAFAAKLGGLLAKGAPGAKKPVAVKPKGKGGMDHSAAKHKASVKPKGRRAPTRGGRKGRAGGGGMGR